VFTPWHCCRKLFWAFHAFPMQFSRVWNKISRKFVLSTQPFHL
jgi:hypothetical protein